jgi:hypothetical protein
MTFEERTAVRMAVNEAKRAWVESEGGYQQVEADAKSQELLLARRARGAMTRVELEAQNEDLRRRLKSSYNKISGARRSVDLWKRRAAKAEQDRDKWKAKAKKRAVDSQSTGRIR